VEGAGVPVDGGSDIFDRDGDVVDGVELHNLIL
jgi:hypothetical protein